MRCSPQEQEVFFHKSLNLFKRIYADELSNALTTFQSYMKYGLNIETWGVYDESEYTDGTGIRFRFFNPTDQTIKYITINFVGYNAVDDPVSSRGKTVQTRKWRRSDRTGRNSHLQIRICMVYRHRAICKNPFDCRAIQERIDKNHYQCKTDYIPRKT